MNKTILSKNDVSVLEQLVVQYGRIVTSVQLNLAFPHLQSIQSIRNRIFLLSKNGWLVRIKKGLYLVNTDLSNLSFNDLSYETISQTINPDSYVSFENALAYYSMFDQLLSSVHSITPKKTNKYIMLKTALCFHHIKKNLYFGFSKKCYDTGMVNVADIEKALLDMLYFPPTEARISLIQEILENYSKDIDIKKLITYAKKFNLSTIRRLGFLLDHIGIETNTLHKELLGNTSFGYLTIKAKIFNARWRIYFDPRTFN